MNKIEKLLDINQFSRSGEKQNKIEKIVIHYIGNPNTSAMANRNYFNNLKNTHQTYASSHDIVGLQGEVINCIPYDEVAFHSGSYSMNRKSIGIEVCHPDSSGKFSDVTMNALIELLAELVKKYNLTVNDIIRHYDVTGKQCPLYYVDEGRFNELKQKVQNKIDGGVVPTIPQGSEEKPMLKFKNGRTVEPIYADSNHTVKIGSLNKYEECECFGIFNGAPMVRYRVGNTNNFKIGFAVDTRCVK